MRKPSTTRVFDAVAALLENAVHLPYKEMVAGSIPASPISPPKPLQCKGFSGPKGSLFLWQIALDLADLARILARFGQLPISKGFSTAGPDSL